MSLGKGDRLEIVMKKIDMIVRAPHFYTMEGDGTGYLSGKAMLVNEGKIIGFIDEADSYHEYKADEELNLDHHVILPGFIDGHMHTEENIAAALFISSAQIYEGQAFEI